MTNQLDRQGEIAVLIGEKEVQELERQAEIHNFAQVELINAEETVRDLEGRKLGLDEASKAMGVNIARLTKLQNRIDDNREDLGRVIQAKLDLIQSLRKSKV